MTVKDLKDLLNNYDDSKIIYFMDDDPASNNYGYMIGTKITNIVNNNNDIEIYLI